MKKVLIGILAAFLVAAVAAGIYFYPDFKAMKTLKEQLDFKHFSYEMTVQLDRNSLSEEQENLFINIEKISGVSFLEHPRFYIAGEVDEDKIHTFVYPTGAEEPVAELYFSDDVDMINGAMFYEKVRTNLIEKSSFLEYILPAWEDHKYVTFAQMEQMFGINLQSASRFSIAIPQGGIGFKEALGILTKLDRQKNADGSMSYILNQEDLTLELRLDADGEEPMALIGHVDQPVKKIAQVEDALSTVGLTVDSDSFKHISDVDVKVVPDSRMQVTIPEDSVSQTLIDSIEKIRNLFS